jgi:hypothetical protein
LNLGVAGNWSRDGLDMAGKRRIPKRTNRLLGVARPGEDDSGDESRSKTGESLRVNIDE